MKRAIYSLLFVCFVSSSAISALSYEVNELREGFISDQRYSLYDHEGRYILMNRSQVFFREENEVQKFTSKNGIETIDIPELTGKYFVIDSISDTVMEGYFRDVSPETSFFTSEHAFVYSYQENKFVDLTLEALKIGKHIEVDSDYPVFTSKNGVVSATLYDDEFQDPGVMIYHPENGFKFFDGRENLDVRYRVIAQSPNGLTLIRYETGVYDEDENEVCEYILYNPEIKTTSKIDIAKLLNDTYGYKVGDNNYTLEIKSYWNSVSSTPNSFSIESMNDDGVIVGLSGIDSENNGHEFPTAFVYYPNRGIVPLNSDREYAFTTPKLNAYGDVLVTRYSLLGEDNAMKSFILHPDLQMEEVPFTLDGGMDGVIGLSFNDKGQVLGLAYKYDEDQSELLIWDPQEGEHSVFNSMEQSINGLRISRDMCEPQIDLFAISGENDFAYMNEQGDILINVYDEKRFSQVLMLTPKDEE